MIPEEALSITNAQNSRAGALSASPRGPTREERHGEKRDLRVLAGEQHDVRRRRKSPTRRRRVAERKAEPRTIDAFVLIEQKTAYDILRASGEARERPLRRRPELERACWTKCNRRTDRRQQMR